MASFDLRALLQFDPPRFHCEKCLALFKANAGGVPAAFTPPRRREDAIRCPVCGVEYVTTGDFSNFYDIDEYLEQQGMSLKLEDPVEHCRELAAIAQRSQTETSSLFAYPPLRALFRALSVARRFVHICTFNIDLMMIGALRATAQHVPVRGVVSSTSNPTVLGELKEIDKHSDEAPGLALKVFASQSRFGEDTPHQKLVVIDGLLAFKGSANLSTTAWRKAAQGRDVVEIVTEIDQVIELNNRLFSPIWAQLSDKGDSITMEKVPF